MTATNSDKQDRINNVLIDMGAVANGTLDDILASLQRIEHILALDFVARFGTEHEAEYAKRHLLNEFRAQAREVINGHEQ